MNIWMQRCQRYWTVSILWLYTVLSTSRGASPLGALTRQLNTATAQGFPDSLAFDKRQRPGADSWSICPSSMERVDCFYEYLRVYARLRKAASSADSVSVRNIGKRADLSSTKSSSPSSASLPSFFSFLLSPLPSSVENRDPTEESHDRDGAREDKPCPEDMDLFLCMIQQSPPGQSLPDPCPVGLSSDLCTVLRLDSFMTGLAQILSRERKLR